MNKGKLNARIQELESELDNAKLALRQAVLKMKDDSPDYEYPRDVFRRVIETGNNYSFYLFQWVPYQTEMKKWRLKMHHDVKTFDGRIEYNIWPNGEHCGSFHDSEVAFIRISRTDFEGKDSGFGLPPELVKD
jgi:hypothetical protein